MAAPRACLGHYDPNARPGLTYKSYKIDCLQKETSLLTFVQTPRFVKGNFQSALKYCKCQPIIEISVSETARILVLQVINRKRCQTPPTPKKSTFEAWKCKWTPSSSSHHRQQADNGNQRTSVTLSSVERFLTADFFSVDLLTNQLFPPLLATHLQGIPPTEVKSIFQF